MSENAPASSRRPRWMAIVLTLSLAFNLAIAGLVVGAWLGREGAGRADRGAEARVERLLGRTPFVAALAPHERRAVLAELRERADPLARNRAELRQRLEAVLETLRAEELDRARLEALIAEQRMLGVRRMEMGEAVLIDRIAAMSLGERRAYADRLDRSIQRGPRGTD